MRQRSVGQTVSPWLASTPPIARPALRTDIDADVAVIGAGVAGLSVAYALGAEGRSVVVVDAAAIGSGQSGRTTAHLSNAIDDLYQNVASVHGDEGARLIARSHSAAIDRIESVAKTEGIACDFERLDGYLFLAPGDDPDLIRDELEAARAAGLHDVTLAHDARLGARALGPALRFPRQGQFHVMKYLAGLAEAIERQGGRIYGETRAQSVEGGTPARVTTAHAVITSGSVVVATNTPFVSRVIVHARQAAYQTYVIAAEVTPGSITRALYWDTADPYHYVRLHTLSADGGGGAREVLIVGGEDHKTGQADDADERWARLEAWAREHVPGIEDIAFRWSGEVMEPVDRLGLIGRNPNDADNVFIVTGDTGMGMTHGMIASLLLPDLIAGRPNEWAEVYDPSRVRLRSAPAFLGEATNMAAQYADWVGPGDVSSADEIRRGAGAIVRRGATKVAAYRDEEGTLHECSAVCPHLGCIVAWNGGERTWDCPCHGSRFDARGRVLNGPAVGDLPKLESQRRAS